MAAFFNREVAATNLYTTVRRDYLELRREALAQRGEPPLVCWVYKDWDGDYAMSFAAYKKEYVTVSGRRGLRVSSMHTRTVGTHTHS